MLMKPSDIENAKLGATTLEAFFAQFGPMDEQSIIVLDYVLELLWQATNPNKRDTI